MPLPNGTQNWLKPPNYQSIRDSYIVLVENYHPLPQYIAEEFMLFVYLH